jgi:hypothetical protein
LIEINRSWDVNGHPSESAPIRLCQRFSATWLRHSFVAGGLGIRIERPIDLERFRGVVAIQQAIHDARGELDTVMNAIVHETSVMPQSNGVVVELRDGD